MNTKECPRCLGKKYLDEADIKRIFRLNGCAPTPCTYCNKQGFIDSKKTNIVSLSKVNVFDIHSIEDVPFIFYEKTMLIIFNTKNFEDILGELEKDGIPRELAEKILSKSKAEINERQGKIHRVDANIFFLLGIIILAIGAILKWILTLLSLAGEKYDISIGIMVVGGLLVLLSMISTFQDKSR